MAETDGDIIMQGYKSEQDCSGFSADTLDFSECYDSESIENAGIYFKDLIKIIKSNSIGSFSPNQLGFFAIPQDGGFAIAYCLSKNPKCNINPDFVLKDVSPEKQSAYSIALTSLCFLANDNTNKIVTDFRNRSIDEMVNVGTIKKIVYHESLKLFYSLFKGDINKIPSIKNFPDDLFETVFQFKFTQEMAENMAAQEKADNMAAAQEMADNMAAAQEMADNMAVAQEATKIDPNTISKSDLPDYIKEILLCTKSNWEKGIVKEISLNQIEFYKKGSPFLIKFNDDTFMSSIIRDVQEYNYEKGIQLKDKITCQIGLISLYLMTGCSYNSINDYLGQRLDKRCIAQVFTQNKIYRYFGNSNNSDKETIANNFTAIAFVEGCMSNEVRELIKIPHKMETYTLDELLNHLYITRNSPPNFLFSRLFDIQKEKGEREKVDITTCSTFYFGGGGLGSVYFRARPIYYSVPNNKAISPKWVPYYLHKCPIKYDEAYQVYILNEIKYNFIIEKLQGRDLSLSHSFTVPDHHLDKFTFYMLYGKGMNLQQYVRSYQLLNNELARKIYAGFAKALGDFHRLPELDESLKKESKQVCHRDIKPENAIIEELQNGEFKITLIDYGVANKLSTDTSITNVGSTYFTAPEVKIIKCDRKPYNKKVDIYSFGVSICTSFINQSPFIKKDSSFYKLKPTKGDSPRISIEAADLIEMCLREDPIERIGSAEEMLKHPFFDSKSKLSGYYINKDVQFDRKVKTINLQEYLKYTRVMAKCQN